MNRRYVLTSTAVILLGGGLLAWALRPRAVAVEMATATRGPFVATVDELAKTRIRDHFVVTSPLAGDVERITLREGDDVTAGSVIARLHPVLPGLLDSRTALELGHRLEAAQAAMQRAEARVKAAEVALEMSRRELERTAKLSGANLVPRATLESDVLTVDLNGRELDSARADAHVAQHEVDIAAAALARTREAQGRGAEPEWLVRAPIGGRVLRVQQKSGGTVAVGSPLIEFGDPGNLEVVIELLTTEAPQVAAGASVRLDHWGGAMPLMGRVRRIEPWGFTKISALGVEEQRVNVLVDIVTERSAWSTLGEGYRLDAHIVAYQRTDALRVPTGAVLRVGDQWSVFSVGADGRAHVTTVAPGRRNDAQDEILSGLKDGDRVVLYPGDAVTDGARLVAAPAGR